MNSKRLIALSFLCFLMVFSFFSSFNIREAKATTITVTRVFSSLNPDCEIRNYGSDYGTVRNATSATVWGDCPGNLLGQQYSGGTYYLYRQCLYFQTSIIPDNTTIKAVTLSLNIEHDYSDTDFNTTVLNGQPTYPHLGPIGTDYNMAYYSGNGGSRNTSSISGTGYWNITFNSDGLSWINVQGVTKFFLRSSRDIDNIAPTAYEDERLSIQMYEAGETLSPKLYVTYEVEGYSYILHGPYYENGAVADCITNVTLYSKTNNPFSFFLNGSDGVADTVTIQNDTSSWYFQWNASQTALRYYYVTQGTFEEFWLYVADPAKAYETYTIKFMDLAGVLNDMPYVKVQRYINGVKAVEKAKVDVEKKLVLYLEKWVTYTLVIEDTTASYTFGDLLFGAETSITLTLKGIEFPQDIILAYQYNRIYAYRHDNQSSISILYQDVQERASNVSINIFFENETSIGGIYPYMEYDTYYLNHTFSNAVYDITYIVRVTIYHPTYGEMHYNTILGRAWSTQPWVLPIGSIPGMNIADLIPIIIIFACFLVFSQINAPTGAFIGTFMAIILTWLGWITIPSGLLVAAICFCVLFALAHKRRRE